MESNKRHNILLGTTLLVGSGILGFVFFYALRTLLPFNTLFPTIHVLVLGIFLMTAIGFGFVGFILIVKGLLGGSREKPQLSVSPNPIAPASQIKQGLVLISVSVTPFLLGFLIAQVLPLLNDGFQNVGFALLTLSGLLWTLPGLVFGVCGLYNVLVGFLRGLMERV